MNPNYNTGFKCNTCHQYIELVRTDTVDNPINHYYCKNDKCDAIGVQQGE